MNSRLERFDPDTHPVRGIGEAILGITVDVQCIDKRVFPMAIRSRQSKSAVHGAHPAHGRTCNRLPLSRLENQALGALAQQRQNLLWQLIGLGDHGCSGLLEDLRT
jgi:hypothetical protein